MLKIREDRRALVRRIEISRIAVGRSSRSGHRVLVRPDRPGRVLLLALREQPDPLGQGHGAARLRARPQRRRSSWRTSPAYTLHLYRREAKDLEASVDFAVGLLEAASRTRSGPASSADRRDPEFVPIPIAENLAHRGGRGDRGPRAGASGVRDHGLAAPALQARRRGRARSRAISRRRRPSRSGAPGTSTGSATGSARRGSRAPTRSFSAGRTASGASSSTRTAGRSPRRSRVEARPGQNLFLTLDLELQRDRRGVLPRTRSGPPSRSTRGPGEILALVSSPSYDPNWFTRRVTLRGVDGPAQRTRTTPLQNRAIQNMYSPGSVFKIFLAYGALAPGTRGSGARRSSAPATPTFYGRDLPVPQEGRPRLGQPAQRDQGLVRRLLLQPRATARRRPDRGDRPRLRVRRADRHRPRPSRSRASSPRRSGRARSDGARWYPSETISVAIGQGPVLVTPLQVARALVGPGRGRPPADAAPLPRLAGPEDAAPACATRRRP